MAPAGSIADELAKRWLERTLESYPSASRAVIAARQDPFRNPTGHVLQENLQVLARQLLGSMNPGEVAASIDALIRLRAVQDLPPSQAVRFVLDLREIAAEFPGAEPGSLNNRIDALALIAFDKYMACREQIFELRLKELRCRAACAPQPE